MAGKMKKCKTCGAEIASNAEVCPQCGAKNKKPFYTRWWFIVIVIVVVIGAIGSMGSSGGSGTDPDGSQASAPGGTAGQDDAQDIQGEPSAPEGQDTQEEPGGEDPEPVTYTHYNVTELFDTLENNALKAERTFQDQYVELEGYLSNIDSDGKYIGVGADPDNLDYLFDSVQCYIKSDEQLDQIMEMSAGDAITVRGRIKDIGEILGYQLDIDSIN